MIAAKYHLRIKRIINKHLKIIIIKTNKMATTKWQMDSTHSELQFKVKHMMVSTVTGHFKQFNATIETQGDDIATAKINFTGEVASISTNNEQRDGHLLSGDFFDVANHPQITFVSDKLEKIDDEKYKLHGTFTMRGVSKQIALDVEYGGMVQDPWGNTRIGFEVNGKINRKDYGVSWSAVTEAGGLVVSDDVKLHANAEFIKEQVAQTA
jgi:polyisoprenoid-binding protein YceI